MTRNAKNDKDNTGSKESGDNGERFDASDQNRSRKRALKILGNRYLSSQEMGKRLINKGEHEETAFETVKWLEDLGAINDAQCAEAVVRHYSTKGYGHARIKDEFYKRGIPREFWDDALAGLEVMDMDEAALKFLEKKLRGSIAKDELRRSTDALCRRGFSYEDAQAMVGRYLESIENTEESGKTE